MYNNNITFRVWLGYKLKEKEKEKKKKNEESSSNLEYI